MAKTIILDEWHLTIRIPTDLQSAEADAIRQTINTKVFQNQLLAAIRKTFHAVSQLAPCRISLSR